MDRLDHHLSLLNYLALDRDGFFIDLMPPSSDRPWPVYRRGPFSKFLPARIVSDRGDTVRQVLLMKQRDRYDLPDSMVPVANPQLEAAWQNCLDYHAAAGETSAPIMLKNQVRPDGTLQSFNPLFVCEATRQWFHPACPQCGMPLSLCRDDALLQRRGLPTYTDSLVRFVACSSCVHLSDTAMLYCHTRTEASPDHVADHAMLVDQWQQMLTTSPDYAELPCRGCPSIQECYGPDRLAKHRIHAWAFYPFFMLMVRAPSMTAADFVRMIGGDPDAMRRSTLGADLPAERQRFFFQDHARRFLEILYLKLIFLEQVTRQLIPDGRSTTQPPCDLALDSIGVDWALPGSGLPAYWYFKARILDAVGSFSISPFAPQQPVPPRLHFLGALWFRTLLVNSRQSAATVFDAVGLAVEGLASDIEPEQWTVALSDKRDVFDVSQVFWNPVDRFVPEAWHPFWQQALRLGLQLVQVGIKADVPWERDSFMRSLGSLRETIHAALFTATTEASSDRIRTVLGSILERWEQQANDGRPMPRGMPATDGDAKGEDDASSHASPRTSEPSTVWTDRSGWDADLQDTVILTPPKKGTNGATRLPKGEATSVKTNEWTDDDQATVVIQPPAARDTKAQAPPSEDLDKTLVISPKVTDRGQPRPAEEKTLAVTGEPTPAPRSPAPNGSTTDPDATVVIDPASRPPIAKPPSMTDDDGLETTVVQPFSGQGKDDALSLSGRPLPSPPPHSNDLENGTTEPSDDADDIMEQTVIIRSDVPKE